MTEPAAPTAPARPSSRPATRPAPVRRAPAQSAPPAQASNPAVRLAFNTLESIGNRGERVVIYGTGGVGKTTLACHAPGPVAFFDLDDSLPRLKKNLPAGLDVRPIPGVNTFGILRAMLQAPGWERIRTIVIDSFTRAEELGVAHTLATVPMSSEKATMFPKNVEGYGYGKGYQNVFEAFLPIYGDLDRHAAEGRNVILVCHECTSNVPNPRGEDYIRYEPRLQQPSSGKASIRARTKEWCDDMIFVGFDLDVSDGIARGNGSRTAYPVERPFCMAKTRSLPDQDIIFAQNDPAFWHFLRA